MNFPWLLDRGIFRVFEMKSGQVETKQEVADLKRTNSVKVMLLINRKLFSKNLTRDLILMLVSVEGWLSQGHSLRREKSEVC